MKRGGPLKRNTALKAAKPLTRTGRLKPVSDKMRAQQRVEADLKQELLRRDGGCIARLIQGQTVAYTVGGADTTMIPLCLGPLDKHELIKRSAWRNGATVDTNCVILCRRHNGWVEDEPNAARALGLSLRRGPPHTP